MAVDILVVDDEADIRDLIAGILEDEGFHPRTAANSQQVFAVIAERAPSLVVLDVWLDGSELDGLEILERLRAVHPEMPVVVVSGHGTIETAVTAIRNGAYDFVEKPFNSDRLILSIRRALEASRLRRENRDLLRRTPDWELVGKAPVITQLRQLIERISEARSRVLITGPAGSGKEVIARQLHRRSDRADRPFVVVSAAGIAPERMEEELFGVADAEGGAAKIGHMERAHGGVLMLDEVADMPLETQSKILRVLVDQRFRRVGGDTPVSVDVRIISTSSKDLMAEAAAGQFREDLYHRLSVVPIEAPALREHREDIPELVQHLVERIADATGLPRLAFGDEALVALQTYDWPGNVRQLRNVVERVMILTADAAGGALGVDALPSEVLSGGPAAPNGERAEQVIALPLRDARERFEREYLVAQISRFGGNISRTAAFVGMERSALHRKLKSLGVTSNGRADAPR
ncbi:MAG: sigma-54 dependent transcriptional regulator [Pseudomonadota bacterium]